MRVHVAGVLWCCGLLTLGVGCPGDKPAGSDTGPASGPEDDADGDGVLAADDCDDDDDEVGAATDWFADADGDGFGDPGAALGAACETPEDGVADDSDCDDEDSEINPDAREICDDGEVDEDCDGVSNDDDDDVKAETWYMDQDDDGYGDPDSKVSACERPEGAVDDRSDCDDSRDYVNPDGVESCDELDLDEDCNGVSDNDDAAALDTTTYYTDNDDDGYGDPEAPIQTCDLPRGAANDNTDCDDTVAEVNPGATEVCDEEDLDEDCDGLADDEDDSVEGLNAWYADLDADGYGDASREWASCDEIDGAVADGTDCDDTDAAVNPGAAEVCDEDDLDEDCDGLSDDSDDSVTDVPSWYTDADEDGYGDDSTAVESCEGPSDTVDEGGDCDDDDEDIHPDATDTCGGVDEDCDGSTDEDAYEGASLIEVESSRVRAIDPDGGGASTLTTLSGASASGGARSVAVDYDNEKSWFVGRSDEALYRLDVCKGAVSKVGSTGGSAPCGMVVLGDGSVIGIRDDDDTLVAYSTTTGKGTAMSGLTESGADFDLGYCGAAYDCTHDTLWVYDATNMVLLAVDPETSEITSSLDVGLSGTSVGLEWDPSRGELLLGLGSTLYALDISSGLTTTLGSSAGDDLAWYPSCD